MTSTPIPHRTALTVPLQVGPFSFCWRAETESWLPHFKGSTLRGAFGSALKRAVCVRRDLNCEICMVRPSCVYTQVFETLPPEGVAAFRGQKYAPHPYVLEPPLEEKQKYEPGERLTFGLTLIGRAIAYLPYVIYALDQAGQKGIGQRRGRFALESVFWPAAEGENRLIYNGAEKRLIPGPFGLSADEFVRRRLAGLEILKRHACCLRVVFLTPLRLRVQRDLQDCISFELLMRSLLRRLWHLSVVHGEGELRLDHRALIERATSVRVVRSDLHWLDWERYSHRQRTKMKLGGLVGEVEYGFTNAAEMAEFLPLLILGEFLHVGTSTTFGLGKYEIQASGSESEGG